ncbi:VOC family protein [Streptomyces murinus]|uniref:hypothetical protein n=1 Tax=Streptomyces murinus TaxID=33900 RepID=UPI0038102C35
MLELPEAPSWGPFTNIQLPDGVLLQFAEPPVEIQMKHYAFLIDDELFDRAYRRLFDRGIEHGGRGVYFKDPAGHAIELITRPYL